jgi:hypothetical protein
MHMYHQRPMGAVKRSLYSRHAPKTMSTQPEDLIKPIRGHLPNRVRPRDAGAGRKNQRHAQNNDSSAYRISGETPLPPLAFLPSFHHQPLTNTPKFLFHSTTLQLYPHKALLSLPPTRLLRSLLLRGLLARPREHGHRLQVLQPADGALRALPPLACLLVYERGLPERIRAPRGVGHEAQCWRLRGGVAPCEGVGAGGCGLQRLRLRLGKG